MNEHHSGDLPSQDTVMSEALRKVQEDFPEVSHRATEAHWRLTRAHNVYSEVLNQRYGEVGLSVPRFNLLWVLYRSPGKRLSIGDLADQIGITPPSVMTMVQALESEGWLQTVKGETDRRVTFAELAGNQEARFNVVLEEMLGRWGEMWSGLSDEELTTLIALLVKLRLSLVQEYLGGRGLAAFRAQHGDKARPGAGER